MTWPPIQPAREDLPEDERFFWDAIVARGRGASVADRQTLAMIYDQAAGPERALYTGDVLAEWDGVERDSSYMHPEKHAIPYGQLLHSPELAWHVANIGALTRLRSERDDSYSQADREWVSQVIYTETGISYFQRIHLGDALGAGVRREAIQALYEGREWDLTDDERLLTAFIRSVLERTMTATLWERMEERLGTVGTVDYAILICGHMLVSTLTRALNFYPNYTRKSIDQLLDAFTSGEAEIPDHGPNQPDDWADEWGVKKLLASAGRT